MPETTPKKNSPKVLLTARQDLDLKDLEVLRDVARDLEKIAAETMERGDISFDKLTLWDSNGVPVADLRFRA